MAHGSMTNTRGTAIQREQPVEKRKDTLGWVTVPSRHPRAALSVSPSWAQRVTRMPGLTQRPQPVPDNVHACDYIDYLLG